MTSRASSQNASSSAADISPGLVPQGTGTARPCSLTQSARPVAIASQPRTLRTRMFLDVAIRLNRRCSELENTRDRRWNSSRSTVLPLCSLANCSSASWSRGISTPAPTSYATRSTIPVLSTDSARSAMLALSGSVARSTSLALSGLSARSTGLAPITSTGVGSLLPCWHHLLHGTRLARLLWRAISTWLAPTMWHSHSATARSSVLRTLVPRLAHCLRCTCPTSARSTAMARSQSLARSVSEAHYSTFGSLHLSGSLAQVGSLDRHGALVASGSLP